MRRNKLCFGLGTLGRDGVYTLVSMYLLTYLTEVVGLSNEQLAIIGGLMVVFRVFDALNDPVMGTIVDNTNTRWGKFKPWILFGVLASGLLTVLLFTDLGLSGGAYIAFIAGPGLHHQRYLLLVADARHFQGSKGSGGRGRYRPYLRKCRHVLRGGALHHGA